MIVAAGQQVEICRSPDLQTWEFASAFGEGRAPGFVWECPDLFSLPDANGNDVWILLSSFLGMDNFQGKFSPCFAAYFAGTFDGHAFAASPDQPGGGRRVSWGPDDYAPVTFAGAPGGRRVLLEWLNHWGYAGHLGTSPWTGQMTLPRELAWQNNALTQRLPPEFEAARFWPQAQLSPRPAANATAAATQHADFAASPWELTGRAGRRSHPRGRLLRGSVLRRRPIAVLLPNLSAAHRWHVARHSQPVAVATADQARFS